MQVLEFVKGALMKDLLGMRMHLVLVGSHYRVDDERMVDRIRKINSNFCILTPGDTAKPTAGQLVVRVDNVGRITEIG